MVIDKNTEIGQFVVDLQKLEPKSRERLMGYFNALKDMEQD